MRFGANPCSSVGHNFPLISLIYTDILCFRAHPCSSVVGIISPCAPRRNLNYLNQITVFLVGIVEISASVASKEVKFLRFGANPCSSVGL